MSDVTIIDPPASRQVRRSARGRIGQLWASIFFAPAAKIPKMLMVTAAERREGSTQIAASLAIVGAQSHSELKIVLVDFNLHHPRLDKVMGVEPAAGLAEVIHGDVTLEDALCPTGLPNLSLLTAGKQLDQPLGLLRSQRLTTVLTQLQQHAQVDHVIIDAAAANLYPEAQTLAGLVDGVVLVTRAGVTRRESVAEAKKRIEQNQGHLLGLVLNQQRYAIPGFLYRRL